MCEEIDLARQWVRKANNDLLNADNNLRSERVPYDTVCFHCQQAAEKLLKAYLVCEGQSPPYTHDLFLLLETILPFHPQAEALRDALSVLMPYAIEVRYPDDWYMPLAEDAEEARDAVNLVRDWLTEIRRELFESPKVSGGESGI